MEEIKKNLLNVFYHLGYVEIGIFLFVFVLFLLFFMLTLLSYPKKIISPFLFILSFLILLSTPFVIKFIINDGFYKTQISYNKVAPLQYANAFLVDIDIKNIGKREILKCLLSVDVYHSNNNAIEKLKNFIRPQATFKYLVQKKIPINQTRNVVVMIDKYYYRKYPYHLSVDCH